VARGRILGQNPDKSLKSFSPCYSQLPLLLCFEISISLNPRNLLQFLRTVQLVYNVKEKGGKHDRKLYPVPYGSRNPYRTLSLRTLKIIPRNLKATVYMYVHVFGFRLGSDLSYDDGRREPVIHTLPPPRAVFGYGVR
jgi:hypothetical protein